MPARSIRPLLFALLAALGCAGGASASSVGATAFTYQGRLEESGSPANGSYDFRFVLAVSPSGDPAVGTNYRHDIEVVDGLFTVELDFNAIWNGNPRYLAVAVRPGSEPNGSNAGYLQLGGWELVRPAPHAIYAAKAGGLHLPIDEHVNFLGASCVKIRNDVSVAIAGHSDGGWGLYGESVDGVAVFGSSANGWAANFQGRVHVSGALGIGTASLGALKLAVNGGAAKPGGGGWSTLSDRRAKRGIAPIEGALATLLSLRGVRFEYEPEWIDSGLGIEGPQIGFVAQEVRETLPGWVDEQPDGMLLVTERGATALLVEAIRELEARLAEREAQLEQLAGRLERLERLELGSPTDARPDA